MHLLAAAIAALVVQAAAMPSQVADAVRPAGKIPADAVVIYASQRAGETDPWSLKADALYVANGTGKVTRITYSRFAHNHFSVSPNRRYIAANRYTRGDQNHDGKYFPYDDWKSLWVIDTVTGKERMLAPDYDAGWGGLAWSADSKWIYFSGPAAKNVMEVKRVNIETGKVEAVTDRLNQLLGYPAGETRKSVTDIDVSDDGQWLIYNYRSPEMMVGGMTGGQPKARIGMMKLDKSEAHLVSDGGPLPAGRRGVWPVGDFDPDICSDGKHIVFARMTASGWVTPDLSTWDLWMVDTDGKNAHNLSGQDETSAEVIPNCYGGKVAFSRAEIGDGRRMPYVLDLATGVRTRMDVEGRHAQMIPTGKR
jgi:Tol biopolymer transport system component